MAEPTYQTFPIDKPDPHEMETHRCRCTPLFHQEDPGNTRLRHRTFLAVSLERSRLRITTHPILLSLSNPYQFHPSCFLRLAMASWIDPMRCLFLQISSSALQWHRFTVKPIEFHDFIPFIYLNAYIHTYIYTYIHTCIYRMYPSGIRPIHLGLGKTGLVIHRIYSCQSRIYSPFASSDVWNLQVNLTISNVLRFLGPYTCSWFTDWKTIWILGFQKDFWWLKKEVAFWWRIF